MNTARTVAGVPSTPTLTLPTFIIAGERRCGTTSLVKWLDAHPEIYMPPRLDHAYFLEAEIAGKTVWRDGEVNAENWERTHSPEEYATHFSESGGHPAVGEKCADYLFWRPSHHRLQRFLPDTRFIISLRDPVGRAWSMYWNEVAKGRETLSFEAALAAEEDRCRRSAYARDHLSYVRRGFYDESLADFFQAIPRDRVLVMCLEENLANPIAAVQRVYEFIGVNPELGLENAGCRYNENFASLPRPFTLLPLVRPATQAYIRVVRGVVNRLTSDKFQRRRLYRLFEFPFTYPATRKQMDPATRARLKELYSPHTRRLEEMLGRPFAEWN